MSVGRKPNPIVTVTVATCITKPMEQAMLKLLLSNAHVSVSDYIRDLIRKDLEKRRIHFDQKETSQESNQASKFSKLFVMKEEEQNQKKGSDVVGSSEHQSLR